MASLRLEPRPWEQDKGKDNAAEAQPLKFRVLLSKSCQDDGLDITWNLREIELEPVETSQCPVTGIENDTQKLSVATLSLASSYVEEHKLCNELKLILDPALRHLPRKKPLLLRSLHLQIPLALAQGQGLLIPERALSMISVPRCMSSLVSDRE